MSHKQLKRLVNALPVHQEIRDTIKNIIIKWTVITEVGKRKTPPIRVKREVYQGMSPLLFILITACIINTIMNSPEIIKISQGKQQMA